MSDDKQPPVEVTTPEENSSGGALGQPTATSPGAMTATSETPSDAETARPSLSQIFLAFLRLGLTAFGGAAMAYLGFGLPAFLLMVALAAVYGVTHSSPISLSVFQGLQVIVVAIIARAAFTFGRTTVKAWQDAVIGLAAAAFIAYGGNPMLAIVIGAAAGLLLYKSKATIGEAGEALDTPPLRSTTRPVLLMILTALIGIVTLLLVNRRLFDLSALMLRIDMFAFGGGFASVPLMLHEVVGVRQWMSTQVFMDGIAMGQMTPGPIVVTATFIGYQVAGIAGAVCTTIGIFLPSFVILSLAVPHFDRMKANPWFQRAMRGILPSFVGLLIAVTLKFGLAVPRTPVSALVACGAFTALMLRVEVPWVVVPGAILSAFLFH